MQTLHRYSLGFQLFIPVGLSVLKAPRLSIDFNLFGEMFQTLDSGMKRFHFHDTPNSQQV